MHPHKDFIVKFCVGETVEMAWHPISQTSTWYKVTSLSEFDWTDDNVIFRVPDTTIVTFHSRIFIPTPPLESTKILQTHWVLDKDDLSGDASLENRPYVPVTMHVNRRNPITSIRERFK